MSNPNHRPLFNGKPVIDANYPRAPQTDWGTNIVPVFDHAGVEHRMSATNARQNVSLNGWTMDAREAEARRTEPREPVKHGNQEHGVEGVTSKHLKPRASSPVVNGIAQHPLSA
jgi:hypothetical protein